MDEAARQFPQQPRGAKHLYAVARFDELPEGADPTDGFVLTRGYWEEADAQAQAEKMNRSVTTTGMRYFVLPVRVSDATDSAASQ
jgi:hypothetical protein